MGGSERYLYAILFSRAKLGGFYTLPGRVLHKAPSEARRAINARSAEGAERDLLHVLDN